MKPLEEYMLFTKSGSEKVNVTNPHGVRSAQCSSNFDILHKTPAGPTNLNISQGKDKTWVEDAPQRVAYKPLYAATSVEEEGREQIVVITLATLFVVILICCAYEVYRNDKQYRKRKELETDASILWSKEQAAKLQEPAQSVSFPAVNESQKPVQNGKVTNKGTNGTTPNGNTSHFVNIQDAPTIVEMPGAEVKGRDSKPRRISFRGIFLEF